MVTALQHETEEQMIYRMYRKDGKNIFTIAVETGLTERHIKKVLEKQGISKRFIKDIPDSYFHQAMLKKKSMDTLKRETSFGETTIRNHLRELGYSQVYRNVVHCPTREVLFRKYIVEKMTRKELASYYSTSATTVNRWLEDHDIQRGQIVYTKKDKEEMYRRFLLVNQGRGKPSYKELYVFYAQRGWTMPDLAAEYGVPVSMLRNWLAQYKISPDMEHQFEDTFGITPNRFIPAVTRKEYAQMLGIGYTTVQKIFAEVRKKLKAEGEVLFDQSDYPKGEV